MDHEAHVRLVDAHAEREGGDHRRELVADKGMADALAVGLVHLGVVPLDAATERVRELGGELPPSRRVVGTYTMAEPVSPSARSSASRAPTVLLVEAV